VETTSSYLAFTRKKDYTQLSQQLDQALENMERDGTLKRLHNAYLPPQALIPPKPPESG
jgi:ABC-type amino acid transport substrate-binding protein